MSEKEVYITVAPKSAHDSTPEYTVWTREAAIAYHRKAHPDAQYNNDEALNEFIAVHWAWKATLME